MSYSYIISNQNVAILPAKLQMLQITMNELSVIGGLTFCVGNVKFMLFYVVFSLQFVFCYLIRQFLVNESALKLMKNAFTLKALFVLKIFKFLSWIFGHVEKQLV